MIEYIQYDDDSCLEIMEKIPMIIEIDRIIKISKEGNNFGGINYSFSEEDVPKYSHDFDIAEPVLGWRKYGTGSWGFFMAYDDGKPIGAATVAAKSPELKMLDGRDDIALLWDMRLPAEYRRQGIGQRLFDMAVEWSTGGGYKMMKIECQNTNLPAARFYEKQGAELVVINPHAYNTEKTMFLWYNCK